MSSRSGRLGYSDSGGSVVVVSSAEGSAKNFEEHLAKLQTERDKQLSEIQERYEKAEAILRGR